MLPFLLRPIYGYIIKLKCGSLQHFRSNSLRMSVTYFSRTLSHFAGLFSLEIGLKRSIIEAIKIRTHNSACAKCIK